MLEEFINILIVNSKNEREYGLALKTSKKRKTFYVYRDLEDKIVIQPKDGEKQFCLSKLEIENYLSSHELKTNNDLSYIKPICKYINSYMKG